jgi:hypothetical protein
MKKNKLWVYLVTVLTLLLVIVAIILSTNARKQGEVELSFETIEIAEIPGTGYEYQGKEPSLVIVADKGGIDLLGKNVSTESLAKLENLDFGKFFAIVVFQGIKGTNLYGVEIQRITKQQNTLNIFAHFTERDPSIGASTVVTSPYHIVRIPKKGLSGRIEIVLYSDGREITRRSYTMP